MCMHPHAYYHKIAVLYASKRLKAYGGLTPGNSTTFATNRSLFVGVYFSENVLINK